MAKKKKGSSKKRRGTPPGVDPNEKRRERLEARRRAKAEAIAAQQRAERRARVLRLLFYGALFALAVWFFFLRGAGPDEIAGNEVKSLSTSGEGVHSAPYTYEDSPPVSGPHRNAIPCGSYAQPVPNEDLVHSLEHGAVYALYAPDLPIEQIRQLEALAADYEENLLVAPYTGEMEAPIAVGSWGKRMDIDEFDEDAIREFYDAFAGTGTREASEGCPNDSAGEFEPPEAATPAPGAEVTPDPGATPKATKDK